MPSESRVAPFGITPRLAGLGNLDLRFGAARSRAGRRFPFQRPQACLCGGSQRHPL